MSSADQPFLPINAMRGRAAVAKADSDATYFLDLMYFGELVLKMLVIELLAGLNEDRNQGRYSLEYRLVRADSLGHWTDVLDELLQGPTSQLLDTSARDSQRALAQLFARADDAWQRKSVDLLIDACRVLEPDHGAGSDRKLSLRQWVKDFVWLRNRTRGHGAPQASTLAAICEPLEQSIDLIVQGAPAFSRSWAHVKQNLSGKYRVSPFGGDRAGFDPFLSSGRHIADGVYVDMGGPRRVGLLFTDPDLRDFMLPNGNFQAGRFEVISYVTDDRRIEDGSHWLMTAEARPLSETAAKPDMEQVGQTFSNAPPRREGYVARPLLELQLTNLLTDDRNPVVTLQGRGGVGKTSLALEALNQLSESGDFFAFVWFSARDIDLLAEGPKEVKADALTLEEISQDFSGMMRPSTGKIANSEAIEYLVSCLSGTGIDGPFIFVFDNFETLRDQAGIYAAVNNAVRLPNKVLITTRTRDFKGDFPVEVSGMERSEFATLVDETAVRLGIRGLIDGAYEDDLYEQSNGHPYVAKVVLGEISRARKKVGLANLVATREAMLDALFERSFVSLSAAAQRVFLTLCSWRSLVPRIGLEAVLSSPGKERMDVERAVTELLQVSLVEETVEDGGPSFLSVPLVASLFGKRKLVTSDMKIAVDGDLEILRGFGAIKSSDVAQGLAPRVAKLAHEIAKEGAPKEYRDRGIAVLEHVATAFSPAWLVLGELHSELGNRRKAIDFTKRFLESNPSEKAAWERLVILLRDEGDALGEMSARLQLAEFAEPTFDDLSAAASRLNSILSKRDDALADGRRQMIAKLRELMEERVSEADATDLSRLAWLCMNMQDTVGARHWVTEGLRKDPNNVHCLSLNRRV